MAEVVILTIASVFWAVQLVAWAFQLVKYLSAEDFREKRLARRKRYVRRRQVRVQTGLWQKGLRRTQMRLGMVVARMRDLRVKR